MEPLLVITNRGAGTADEESLEAALAVLRQHSSVEVQATSNPGELNSVLHRAGSRPIVASAGLFEPATGFDAHPGEPLAEPSAVDAAGED